MGLNNTYAVHNDSGSPLTFTVAGAAVGGPSGIGSGSVPASPVLGHTPGKPYYLKGGTGSFNGNGTNNQQTPVAHGLPSGKFQVIDFHAIGIGGWGATHYLYAPNVDQSAIYLAWYLPQTGGVFGSGFNYQFIWSLLAQLLN